ncbi:MAG: MOSC domain-containing protein [Pseudomonadota bacterium]
MHGTPAVTVNGIYRYPVKGLSPEALRSVTLREGQTLPADRRYAIENGPSGFDPADPKYFPKSRFLMLMRNERLAGLQTRFEDDSHMLTIGYNGAEAVRGNLETRDGRAAIETFFTENFAPELKGPPRILSAQGHSFSDVAAKVVSIINLASVAAIETVVGQPVHPLRFRGNLYVSGWPAWHEFDLIGKELTIGSVRLKVVKRIVRCAAVNVDPVTAERDMNIPHALMQMFDHADCGVYAEVIAGGTIAAGDPITDVSSTA